MKKVAIGVVMLIVGLGMLGDAEDTKDTVVQNRDVSNYEQESAPLVETQNQAELEKTVDFDHAEENENESSLKHQPESMEEKKSPAYDERLGASASEQDNQAYQPEPEPEPEPVESKCHPSYSGCLKRNASDYDCAGGSGNGPYYTGKVRVYGSDPFGLDRDNDGWGCE